MTKKRQFIILSLEPIQSRYTSDWFTHIPELFKKELSEFNVIQINGDINKQMQSTPGGFLNFVGTNIWKNEQMNKFFQMVQNNEIDDDAILFFTDAWNTNIIQIKYTNDLMKKNWNIIAIWHGGSYIENDPLEYLINDKSWSYAFEESIYNACDVNWFSTKYHRDYFFDMFAVDKEKALVSGFPMEYIKKTISIGQKENIIMSSARDCPGKQTWIFDELQKRLPQYTFIKTGCGLSKDEYHKTLGKAKIVISFALLETLGIVTGMEALAARALPLVPNRLCFTEEYSNYSDLIYPSEWCEQNKEVNYDSLCKKIVYNMENYNEIADIVFPQVTDYMHQKYFSCTPFIKFIKRNY